MQMFWFGNEKKGKALGPFSLTPDPHSKRRRGKQSLTPDPSPKRGE